MEEYNPDFENNPEKDFWRSKIFDTAREYMESIDKNVIVREGKITITEKDGTEFIYDMFVLQHKTYDVGEHAAGFIPSQEYLEQKLKKSLDERYRALMLTIQQTYN